MNVLNKVTRKTLARNKVRTVVTIVGIMLSAAMFMAVMTSVTSMQGYMLDNVKAADGSWHAWTMTYNEREREALTGDSRVSDSVALQYQGYADIGSVNEYKPYLFIGGVKKSYSDMVPVNILEGRMAEDGSEIMLPRHLRDNGGVEYKIGDKITLQVGRRMWNGTELIQGDPLYLPEPESGDSSEGGNGSGGEGPDGEAAEGEELADTQERSYTVVGFYSRPGWEPRTAPGYTALTVYDEAAVDAKCQVFYQVKKISGIYDFVEDIDPDGENSAFNRDYLMYNGLSMNDGFNSMLYTMAFILSVIIMFGSISLIYNAFSISISERTVQFGIMKSVGATRRQMRRSVMYEGLLLAAIGIPLGILAGILGMFVTFKAIGGLFDILLYNIDFGVKFTIHVKWWAAAVASAVCFLTVIISVNIPARRAAKKPAIEAIKQSGDIRIKGRNVRTWGITYKLFKFEGMLASKNFKRNKRKYRATVISLFLSIVLFISASSFCGYLKRGVSVAAQEYNFDISSRINSDMMEKLTFEQAERIHRNALGASRVTYIDFISESIRLTEDIVPEDMWKVLNERYNRNEDGYFSETARYVFLDDAEYEAYLGEIGLTRESCMDGDVPAAVVYCNSTIYSGKYYYGSLVKDSEKSLKIISYQHDEETGGNQEIITERKVCAYADKVPMGLDSGNYGMYINLIYPYSARNAILGADYEEDFYGNIVFFISSDNPSETYDDLNKNLKETGVMYTSITNIADEVAVTRALVTIIKVFSYGFIVLISMIALANVFNTISTNVGLRRREFAMLKSVGMSKRGFNRMMNYECLLYGIKGTIYGLPVAVLINWLMSRSMDFGVKTEFIMPWSSMGIAVGSVFLVVFATMLYSMNKIRHDNTVETLRRETA